MSLPIIEVSDVAKRYRLGQIGLSSFREEIERTWQRLRGRRASANYAMRDFWALQDISFQVQRGDVLGIIGRNGAGKSTLLKILSRITEPTTGEIVLRGRVASLLEVGTGFHPELSGRENIFLNGAILGMKKSEIARKFDEIVAFAEVDRFIDTPVKRYSSGMYVKLAFAVAAHLEPDILIVDEVLAVGDAAFQKKCVKKMSDVSRLGRTVLFVSHNIGLIHTLCRSAILLEQGRISHHGSVDEAIALYNARPDQGNRFERTGDNIPTDKPAIRSVTMSNPDRNAIYQPDSSLQIDIDAGIAAQNLGALVYVRNQMGTAVQYFNTAAESVIDKRANFCPKHFSLHLDRTCLPPGSYQVDVEIWSPQGKVDGVESAVHFDVADGMFEDRVTRMFVGKCGNLVSHRWEIT